MAEIADCDAVVDGRLHAAHSSVDDLAVCDVQLAIEGWVGAGLWNHER